FVGFAFDGMLAAIIFGPPDLATRIDQYSHERISPVVFALMAAHSSASPGDSEEIGPSIIDCTWNSALRADNIQRNPQSFPLAPATVRPCRFISPIQFLPRARASEAPSSGFTTSMLVSPNSSCWSQIGGLMPPTAPR